MIELLRIRRSIRKLESIIVIGHPGETKSPIPANDLQYEKVKRNRYSRS